MAILWCGGEDVDFPNNSGLAVSTVGIRTGYSRSVVRSSSTTTTARSLAFAGGAITSGWLSFRIFINGTPTGGSALFVGLVKDGSSPSGIYVGGGASGSSSKVTLWKYDGTTKTQLAQESGTSWNPNPAQRVDVQLVNFGASATVNVYVENVLLITYSGDVTVTGVTSVSAVALGPYNSSSPALYSEIIVADEDTRPMLGLLTMAPTAAGTTDQWTGLYSAVNPTTINDANSNYTNTGAQDQQYNLTDEPAGTFAVRAVRVAARAWITVGATANHLKLGFNSGGSVAVGTSQAVGTGATTYEQLWATNPVTSAAWGDATEINALQIDLQSSTS